MASSYRIPQIKRDTVEIFLYFFLLLFREFLVMITSHEKKKSLTHGSLNGFEPFSGPIEINK